LEKMEMKSKDDRKGASMIYTPSTVYRVTVSSYSDDRSVVTYAMRRANGLYSAGGAAIDDDADNGPRALEAEFKEIEVRLKEMGAEKKRLTDFNNKQQKELETCTAIKSQMTARVKEYATVTKQLDKVKADLEREDKDIDFTADIKKLHDNIRKENQKRIDMLKDMKPGLIAWCEHGLARDKLQIDKLKASAHVTSLQERKKARESTMHDALKAEQNSKLKFDELVAAFKVANKIMKEKAKPEEWGPRIAALCVRVRFPYHSWPTWVLSS
jgi:hypothetical protein